jgi:hypothetical protein
VTVFTSPFFIYIGYRAWRADLISKRAAVKGALFVIVISVTAAAFAVFFPGDSVQAESLCQSLLVRGFDQRICEGSLAWLDRGPVASFREAHIDIGPYVWLYLRIVALSLVPLWFVRWRGGSRALLAVAGLLSLTLLFALGVDWGRWVHVFVFCLFCVVLAESVWERTEVRKVPLLVIVLYVATWSVPLCCEYTFGHGFVGQA